MDSQDKSSRNIRISAPDSIFVKTGLKTEKKFVFDKIFQNGIKDQDMYMHALLPLVEAVFYEHKDATLISFGPKGSGIFIRTLQ